jgi:hypothetical protein
VLGLVHSYAIDERTGIPVLRDLPIAGALFGKTVRKDVYGKTYAWIPRDSVRVNKRSEVSVAIVKETFKHDAPKLDGTGVVYLAEENKRARGEVVKINKNEIDVRMLTLGERQGDDIPILEVKKQVPLSDVLLIETQVELTPEQIKLVNSK